jgi:hypothetical protein
MEQRWLKFAFWGTGWVIILEDHSQLVLTTFPWSLKKKIYTNCKYHKVRA